MQETWRGSRCYHVPQLCILMLRSGYLREDWFEKALYERCGEWSRVQEIKKMTSVSWRKVLGVGASLSLQIVPTGHHVALLLPSC